MSLSADLIWRGLIKDKTFDDVAWLDKPRVFYHGYDASMPSLTVGNLAALLLDKRMIDAGWQAVMVMGGGTSLIGDPGGKSDERQLKSREEIMANIEVIRKQVEGLFAGEQFEMVDNYDWLSELRYLDFLRDVGKHFAMSELIQREFVTERLGQAGGGISYAEFSYSLVQGYDYWHLFKKYNTELQVGGSDQWGNILSGVALIRKKESVEVQALSHPLIVNKTTGVKFGKSEEGAIWLDPELTTPTQFYQFWLNSDDADVEEYLKVYTFLSKAEIESLLAEHAKDPAKRLAQTKLAEAVTELVHGSSGRESSGNITKYLTNQVPLAKASDDDFMQLRRGIPHLKVRAGDSLVEIIVKTKLAESNSEARRLLASKAIYINGHTAETELLAAADIDDGRALLRRGKAYKDSALLELE